MGIKRLLRTGYSTLAGLGESQYIEKRSRFVGTATPVSDESEALAFIASIRGRRKDATHNVFAYVLGEGVPKKRYSDDGEPQGTAGIPVLDVIEKNDLSDTVIVVTRYFGGILLGTAGLIRAYGKAASLAVAACGIARLSLAASMLVMVEYHLLGVVRNETEKRGYNISDVKYGVDAELYVTVPYADVEVFRDLITELSAGEAIIEQVGEKWVQ